MRTVATGLPLNKQALLDKYELSAQEWEGVFDICVQHTTEVVIALTDEHLEGGVQKEWAVIADAGFWFWAFPELAQAKRFCCDVGLKIVHIIKV